MTAGFRHISLLTLTPDADVEAVAAAIRNLPSTVSSIRGYSVGVDAGLAEGNATIAVVADFDDVDGYLAYRDDPSHRAVLAEHVAPVLVARTALQHPT
jgi:hypothetical protein